MHFVAEKEGNKPQSEGGNRRVLTVAATRRQLIGRGAAAIAGLAFGAKSAGAQKKMTEIRSSVPDKSQQTNPVSTTTLNVVFNGTMVMGFEEDGITVIAPEIVDQLHLYLINGADFRAKKLKVAVSGNPGRPESWAEIVNPSQVLILNQKDTKGMPVAGRKDAAITLPYPDHILPLRLLDMTFDNAAGGRWAGALVFVYATAVQGSVAVTGTSCTVRNPIANYSELRVLASVRPHSMDPGDHHSKMSWEATAKLIHKDWQWKSGEELNPQPKRVPGMDHDVDDPNYFIPANDQSALGGGGNCKAPIVVVTYKP